MSGRRAVAVWTAADRPRTDPGVRRYRTGLLPRMIDEKPSFGPRMRDARIRQEAIGDYLHSRPCEPMLLACVSSQVGPKPSSNWKWLIFGSCRMADSTLAIRTVMRRPRTDPAPAYVRRPARARLPGNRAGRGSTDRRQSRRRGRTRNIGP